MSSKRQKITEASDQQLYSESFMFRQIADSTEVVFDIMCKFNIYLLLVPCFVEYIRLSVTAVMNIYDSRYWYYQLHYSNIIYTYYGVKYITNTAFTRKKIIFFLYDGNLTTYPLFYCLQK